MHVTVCGLRILRARLLGGDCPALGKGLLANWGAMRYSAFYQRCIGSTSRALFIEPVLEALARQLDHQRSPIALG